MLELIKEYDRVTEILNKNIRGLKAHPKILDKEEHKYLYPAYEKAMYIAISLSDLNIGLKYLDFSEALSNGYEANHFARNVALISYELINHQQKITGQEIAALISEKLGNEGLAEVKLYSKELKSVKKENHVKLNYIRNNLMGHRTESGMEMVKGMLNINHKEIYHIGKQVFGVYLKIFCAYSELLGKL